MKIIFALLFLSINGNAVEWVPFEYNGQVIYGATTATSLSIDPQSFTDARSYLVQAHPVTMGHIPAFQIKSEAGCLQIFRTSIPNANIEGNGLTNVYEKNLEINNGFSDLNDLASGPDDSWVRSVVEMKEGQHLNYHGKNYQTSGEILEYSNLIGLDFYNTILRGLFSLAFKAPKVINTPNPIFSLMIQPFDPADSQGDLSGSIFEVAGGAFVSGVLNFNNPSGIRGNEPGNPFFLLSCE